MTFSTSKKQTGDLLKSQDWNALTAEVERLGKEKLDRNQDDTFKGSLKIEGILTAKEKVVFNNSVYIQNDSLVIKAEEDGEKSSYRLRVKNLDKSDNLAWFDSGEKSSVIALSANNSWKDRVEIANRNNQRIAFCTNGRDVLSITKEHRVGIGTDSPSSELEVRGTLTAGTVTADIFKGVGAFVVGMIIMWHGTEEIIPEGWVFCDGDNDTPDLRSRFIIGAASSKKNSGLSYSVFTSGEQGDPDHHVHRIKNLKSNFTTSENGSHTHKYTDKWYDFKALDEVKIPGTFSDDKFKGTRTAIDIKGGSIKDDSTQENGSHTHSGNVEFNQFDTHESSGDSKPRWYALCFIMYTGKTKK